MNTRSFALFLNVTPLLSNFKKFCLDNKVDAELMSRALIVFDNAAKTQITEEKFDFYLERFTTERDKQNFEAALLDALETLKGPDNIQTNQTSLDIAKDKVIPYLFDSVMVAEETPHGDTTQEREELLMEYELAAKQGGAVNGLLTGIKKIDDAIEAIIPGQLVVVAAASGEGKSFFAANLAWYTSVVEKKNVVVITAETIRSQYRRRILARHSNEVKFGCPLEITKIKNGQLSEEEYETYKMVVEDFTGGDYGMLEISQVANGTTLGDIRIYLEKLRLSRKIDLVIIDYLSLLKPTKRRQSQREETVELFKECKNLAVTFNKGEGIPVVTLHQISMEARNKVKFQPGKFYTLSSLADTSEAAKSADTAIALLRTQDFEDEHELGCGILKTRDSVAQDKLFKLYEAYQYGYIGDLME